MNHENVSSHNNSDTDGFDSVVVAGSDSQAEGSDLPLQRL